MKSSSMQLVLWLILFSLAGASFVSMFQYSSRRKADSIGTVNDEDIGMLEYRRRIAQVQQMIQEARKRYGQHADMILKMWGLDKNPHEAVMENLILEKTLQSASNSVGAHVSKVYMHAKLQDAYFVREFLGNLVPPQAVTKNGIDTAALKYNLERQGMTEDDFEEAVQEAMKKALFQRLLEGGLYVSRGMLKDLYSAEYLKKKLAIMMLPFDEYLKRSQAQKLTESEIATAYDTHKEEYRIPEKRTAVLYTFDPATYGIDIAEKDVESAYHKRKNPAYIEKAEEREVQHIYLPYTEANKLQQRAAAQEILKQVKAAPDSFEKVAQEKSQSKDKGAKIFVKKGGPDKHYERTVFDLEPNDISPVIETKDGFEIVKLIAKKPAVYKPLEKVKEALVASLKADRFRSDFSTNATRVISQASDLPELFKNFITEHKGQQSSLDNVTRTGTQQSSKLFGLSKVGDRSFYVEGTKGYIVELKSITPSVLQPLAEVREKVTQALYKERAMKAMEADVQAAKQKVAQGAALADVAKEYKGSIETTDWIDPQSRDALKKFQDKGIPVDRAMALVKPHETMTDVSGKNGYLIELREIEPFNEADFGKKKAALEREVRKQEESSFVPHIIEELRKSAKVSINPEFARHVKR
jgi:peptidyl-prolyl cis-trans isomerase D